MTTKLERMKAIEDRIDVLEKEYKDIAAHLNNDTSNTTVNRYEEIYTELLDLSQQYIKTVFDKE